MHKKYQQEEDHAREVADQEEGVYKEEEVSRREVLEGNLTEQLYECEISGLCH